MRVLVTGAFGFVGTAVVSRLTEAGYHVVALTHRESGATLPKSTAAEVIHGDVLQSDDMVKRFLASGRTGFYFAVTREGEVGAGDEIKAIARDPNAVPVSEITRLYIAKRYGDADVTSIRRALQVAALPESWKGHLRERLERMSA